MGRVPDPSQEGVVFLPTEMGRVPDPSQALLSPSQDLHRTGAASGHGAFELTLRMKLEALQSEILLAFDEEVRDLRRQQRDPPLPIPRPRSTLPRPAGDDPGPEPAPSQREILDAPIEPVAPSVFRRMLSSTSDVLSSEALQKARKSPDNRPRFDEREEIHDGTIGVGASASNQAVVSTEPMRMMSSTSDVMSSDSLQKARKSPDNRPRFVVREEIHEACEASLQIGYHKTKMLRQMHRQIARHLSENFALPSYVISLYSTAITTWNWLCFILLLKDFVLLPMDAAFMLYELPGPVSKVIDVVAWLSPIVWTCDIVLTFFTSIEMEGEQVGDMRVICWRYLKTWFLIDTSIVLAEWWTLFASQTSRYSLVHGIRCFRVLRCCRIGRYPVIRVASKVIGVPVGSTWLALRVVGLSAFLGATMHWVSCGFFLVFDRPGIPEHYPNSAADVVNAYSAAMYWACGTLTGGPILFFPHTLKEYVYTIVARTLVMMVHVTVVGLVCYDVSACYRSDSVFMTRVARDFLSSHKRFSLKPQTKARLRIFVASHHMRGDSDKMRDLTLFLNSLPEGLRMDLNYEVRGAILTCMHFFAHIDVENNRVLREVADKVMLARLAASNDFLFFAGDPGFNAYICSTGELCYLKNISGLKGIESTSRTTIRSGGWLSEASLWTHWEHCGSLITKTRSAVFTLEAGSFYKVLHDFAHLGVIAVKYARCFVKHLNKHAEEISDCMDFNGELTDFLGMGVNGPVSHYAFISHHKKDAGPEAALMQAGLETIIEMDISHPAYDLVVPIFVDSESLDDLRDLKEHVIRSQYIFLLLTKEVLSRPWCLVEIYTAHQHGIPIVPVLINREGVTFEYPDESFYSRLSDGESFPAPHMRLLEREGVDTAVLAEAIRGICSVIALQFSPNKSQAARSSELADIMARATRVGDTAVEAEASQRRPKPVDPRTRRAWTRCLS